MADTYSAAFSLTGTAAVAAGLANRTANQSFAIGSNSFPAAGAVTYTNGGGSSAINKYFIASYSIPATTFQAIDLSGALANDFGAAVVFTHVKELIIAIESPDGTKVVRVGPQNVANAWQGPFSGGAGATVYEDVFDYQRWSNRWTGWAVTAATADLLQIYNPGATAVTVHVAVLGVG